MKLKENVLYYFNLFLLFISCLITNSIFVSFIIFTISAIQESRKQFTPFNKEMFIGIGVLILLLTIITYKILLKKGIWFLIVKEKDKNLEA